MPKRQLDLNLLSLKSKVPSNEDFEECGYALNRVLGKGYYGIAVSVSHLGSGKKLVWKLLPLGTRNRREAQIATLLRHPHIVKTFEYFILHTQIILVMEELGVTLKQALEERDKCPDYFANKPTPKSWNLKVIVKILKGLEYLHLHNLCHRDLHLENVLTWEDVKIIDVGCAEGAFCWKYLAGCIPTGSKEVNDDLLSAYLQSETEEELITLSPTQLFSLSEQITEQSVVRTTGGFWRPVGGFKSCWAEDCYDAWTIFIRIQYDLTMNQIKKNVKELTTGMFWSSDLIEKPPGREYVSPELAGILSKRDTLTIQEKIQLGCQGITEDTFVKLSNGHFKKVITCYFEIDHTLRQMWAADNTMEMLLGACTDPYFTVTRGVMLEDWNTSKILAYLQCMPSLIPTDDTAEICIEKNV